MTNSNKLRKDALEYHSSYPKGKIQVIPTKSHSSQRDLSLAYSPGVAIPCIEIQNDRRKVYDYTAKGNLVAVISNGTAVLGLGDIGAEASKPVMEGKGLLFKIFADIDVFDIEIDEKDPEKFVEIVKSIAPTFGGINLEDIKAPEAFYIEERLRKELDIPVMHDDQHGTAIISAAALKNALEIAGKKAEDVKIVVNGAGAAAVSCASMYLNIGIRKENLIMCDSKGVISHHRNDLNEQKKSFAVDTDAETLDEAISGADVFVGLSVGNVLTPDMLLSMSHNPVVFALANPEPEIDYHLASKTRNDVIMATGRSDFPNQVNNVLGFPYIFRGALDVQATTVNEEMKLAAVNALSELTKEPVPEMVLLAYNHKNLNFGRDYIIPKPFDNRLVIRVSRAVAKAAMESGVAQSPIEDWQAYEEQLMRRMGNDQKLMRMMQNRAKANPKRLVMSNAEEYNILKAAQVLQEDGVAIPVLLGSRTKIRQMTEKYGIDTPFEIIDPRSDDAEFQREKYAHMFWQKRNRKGVSLYEARKSMRNRDYYGAMMVEAGDADAMLTGYAKSYSNALLPLLEVIGKDPNVEKVSGLMLLLTKKGPVFFADTAIIEHPDWKDLVRITNMSAYVVKSLGMKPVIAMLSYENFSARGNDSKEVAKAVAYLHRKKPGMLVDGEIQPDFALNGDLIMSEFPFSKLAGQRVNTLIFPNLVSGNLSYKILRGINNAQSIGPILLGMKKPVHILQMRCSVEEILNLATIAVLDAQQRNS
ncbi:MAG: NADP-dependent malic enzyme [Flavobacteriaceae bacterium]|nr:NADP-dependent malic enzyme [Flavobacteriaceae bacterium]